MLHKETIAPDILELLKELQNKPYLTDFHLVGESALALYYGHRESIDLDLFTNKDFNTGRILEGLIHDFSFQLAFSAPETLKGHISSVNVDVIKHAYPHLESPQVYDGISLVSQKDIIAMKLNAISISGQRPKDFIDIFYALDHFSLKAILSFYQKKYRQENTVPILKSLIYFEDVDLADWPVLVKDKNLKWKTVQERLEARVEKIIKED